MSEGAQKIAKAREYILKQSTGKPEIAVILGSGLGSLVDHIEIEATVHYSDIPEFPISTVAGHAGQLVLGKLAGKQLVVMQGRFHAYEGYALGTVVFPVRVMQALGATSLIVTNAAGGLNAAYTPGDVMLITDHINTMGNNPLIGPNPDEIGPRFPDMSQAYNARLRSLALEVAGREGIKLQQGVYIACLGPSYETPAERRYLRLIGGDAVGMSTVPEVIAANHAGMRVLGISAITNVATGAADQPVDSHAEVVAVAKIAGEKLVRLVRGLIAAM